MKRLIALLLCLSILLIGCGETAVQTTESGSADVASGISDNVPNINSINDPELLTWCEDSLYSELEKNISDKYTIESVSATYISKEYIDEVMFNSQSNVYFGYTLDELNSMFQGNRYVFTLGDDGKTTVEEMKEIPDTTTETILKNVAIGAGVILVCVVISSVTAGLGAPAVSALFAASAKTGAIMAASSSVLGGVEAGIIRGIETGDMNEALRTAAVSGSEGFKWGAISGAIAGGVTKGISIHRANRSIPSPRQSELDILSETKNATEQNAFLEGKQVKMTTPGSTRPDVVVTNSNGTVHAIEVKNYDLVNNEGSLINHLKHQIASRVDNLPQGSTQEIVLDVRGRGYPESLLKDVVSNIKESLYEIYSDIPVTLKRW